MDYLIDSIVDRLPPPLQYAYDHLPSYNLGSNILYKFYSITSAVPYLPTMIALVSVYILFNVVWSATRTAMRASTFILKYGALLGTALTAWSYVQSSFGGADSSPGRRGQDYWQNRPSKDFPAEDRYSTGGDSNSSPGWTSMLWNFAKPLVSDIDKDTPSSRTRSKQKKPATRNNQGQNEFTEPLGDAAKDILGKALRGESVLGAVWEQIKDAGADAFAGAANNDASGKKKRNRNAGL